MSDHIEVYGKVYYEAAYLELANRNASRRGERIAELERENAALLEALNQIGYGEVDMGGGNPWPLDGWGVKQCVQIARNAIDAARMEGK